MKLTSSIASVALVVTTPVLGFVGPSSSGVINNQRLSPLGVSSTPNFEDPNAGMTVSDEEQQQDEQQSQKQEKVMSKALPFMECPPVLQESDLAGNFGFDPLGFASTKEKLWRYREAEIKHARLAMLAAVGWPLAEVVNRAICDYFDNPTLLEDGGHVPSILNDGLNKISPTFWGFCLGLTAAIDLYALAKASKGDPTYFPGNLGFDPMELYPKDKRGQERMKLAEIKHGRVAMIAVIGYIFEELTTKLSVIDDTPFLFRFAETVEEVVDEVSIVEDSLSVAF